MSTEQRETLDAILRQSAFPVGSDVDEQRRLLRELLSAQPLPADVTVTAAALGGVPTAEITVDGVEPRHVVLYFHGGVYVIGDAFLAAGLAAQVGRRTHAKVISVDYRLAPEHPYPAAVDDALAAYEALLQDGVAPSDIAFAGESAGGGLAIATLVNARDHGLPLPAAAFVMSPYVDLTLAGTTMETKREVDPLLSRELLQPRVTDYTSGQDAALGLISPVFADLSGLPPLIIQAGSHEVLLDDAVRLARQAATADVEVTLDITPRVPHVFQAYSAILDEAAAALDRAGQLLSDASRRRRTRDRIGKVTDDVQGSPIRRLRRRRGPRGARCAAARSRGPARCSWRSAPPASIPSEAKIRSGRGPRDLPRDLSQRRGLGPRRRGRGGRRGRERAWPSGDEVIGFTDNRASHAEYVLVEAANLTAKPAEVPWEVAGALFVAGATGVATVRAVAPTAGEAVVIAGAGGGVGVFAVQLAVRTGARVIALAERTPSRVAARARRGSRRLRRWRRAAHHRGRRGDAGGRVHRPRRGRLRRAGARARHRQGPDRHDRRLPRDRRSTASRATAARPRRARRPWPNWPRR